MWKFVKKTTSRSIKPFIDKNLQFQAPEESLEWPLLPFSKSFGFRDQELLQELFHLESEIAKTQIEVEKARKAWKKIQDYLASCSNEENVFSQVQEIE